MKKCRLLLITLVLMVSQGISQTCSTCNSNHTALLKDGTNLEVEGRVSVKLTSGEGLNPLTFRLLQLLLYTNNGLEIPLSDIHEVYHENSEKKLH